MGMQIYRIMKRKKKKTKMRINTSRSIIKSDSNVNKRTNQIYRMNKKIEKSRKMCKNKK